MIETLYWQNYPLEIFHLLNFGIWNSDVIFFYQLSQRNCFIKMNRSFSLKIIQIKSFNLDKYSQEINKEDVDCRRSYSIVTFYLYETLIRTDGLTIKQLESPKLSRYLIERPGVKSFMHSLLTFIHSGYDILSKDIRRNHSNTDSIVDDQFKPIPKLINTFVFSSAHIMSIFKVMDINARVFETSIKNQLEKVNSIKSFI
ncbi:hypothetical protein ACTFIV_009432 [Dictyostelium citrinum]